MGRNGAGKSRFLRDIDQALTHQPNKFNVRYISPERAGTFKRDGSILTNMSNDPSYLKNVRSTNQASGFKSASAMLFREAETLYLRRLASTPEIRNDHSRNFTTDRLSKVNQLLTNISLIMGDSDFEFVSLSDGSVISPDHISSGESEAVSLAAEILYFFDTLSSEKFNVLLLDEPDVHLHPDLQARLGKLIITMLDEFKEQAENIAVCLTTHSTPLVCSLAASPYTSLGTKNFGSDEIRMAPANTELRKVAPFFGHPLSLSLSDDAALILEGEDDERVWQQAARSSQGNIRVFPVLAGTVSEQGALEQFCNQLLGTIYDNPISFSLRDGDGVQNIPLEHLAHVQRFRLQCYAIENAILTDNCLSVMNTNWAKFIEVADLWCKENTAHPDVITIQKIINSSDRLRHTKIKKVRQLLCSISDIKKPWEVVVGQAIGAITEHENFENDMLVDFLGKEAVKKIILRKPS